MASRGDGMLRQLFVKIFGVLLFLVSLLSVVILVRTFTSFPRVTHGSDCTASDRHYIKADNKTIERFQQALRFQTVSYTSSNQRTDELLKYREFISEAYPTIHSSPLVKCEVVNEYSLLYTIKGSDTSLIPYLLMSHLDVVPAEEPNWEEAPFAGHIRDGHIYGRGAIDAKQSVMAILESLEYLLKQAHQPKRSFYVAFGHDEEVYGLQGAYHVAQILQQRGVKLEFIHDEGMPISTDFVPGVAKPIAMLGTSEKGYLKVNVSVSYPGGHASMPNKESANSILAKAVTRLTAKQLPSQFGLGPERAFLEHIAPEMIFPMRIIASNLWLFGPLVSHMLSQAPSSDAMQRTTLALTQFYGGVKDNVIATDAWAILDIRIHPAQSVQEIIDYIPREIDDDRVKMKVMLESEAHPVSSNEDDCFGYQTMKTSILQVFADVVIAPGLMVATTDSKHYLDLTKNVYRFFPTYMSQADSRRIHGLNERISVKNYEQAINFYHHLMTNADRSQLEYKRQHAMEL